ncbi:MAG: type II toxin-antitoxin system VapB family antitoxin [Verrucomicrobiota bacterium]|nr:type II toxin-antitoxin system VapB family antitoxin [Verrucomicrobiota bacterium]
MRITIELDAKDLRKIQRLTKNTKKAPAVTKAVSEYIREQEKRAFLQKILDGETDYSSTNDEIEAMENWGEIRKI